MNSFPCGALHPTCKGKIAINHQLRQLCSKLRPADLELVWHDLFPIRFQHKHPQKSRLLISSLMNCNAYRTNLWSRFQNSISFTICIIFTWIIYKYVNINICIYSYQLSISTQSHYNIIGITSSSLSSHPHSPTVVFQKTSRFLCLFTTSPPQNPPQLHPTGPPATPRSFFSTAVPRERLLVTGDQSSLSRTSAKRTRESTFCPPEPRFEKEMAESGSAPKLETRSREKREHQSNPGIPDGCCGRFMK